MKRIFFTLLLCLLFYQPAEARDWTLYFVDQLETIGTGEDAYEAYVLGSYNVRPAQVVKLISVTGTDLFIYTTKKASIAADAYTIPEFVGFGYTDIITRLTLGLGNAGTINQVKYMIGAHWFSGGEWYFGNIHQWETAGSSEPVWFGRYRGILGVDTQ